MISKNVLYVVAGVSLAFIGAVPQAVHAAESFRSILVLPTDVVPTSISGYASRQTVKEPGSSAILSGLEMDEVGDKPCFVRAHWWRFTMENLPQELTTDFNICPKPVDGDKSATFYSARETKTGVRAIQVCNNNQNNHRVKGVKIFGAVVDQNGSGKVVPSSTTEEFERTNCNHPWKAVRECSSGQVAVGLLIEHTDDEVTGLGLRCAKPIVKEVRIEEDAVSLYNKMEADIQVQIAKNGGIRTLTINEAVALHEVAGATVVVIDEGKVAVVRHYGMRNAKENLKTNGDTLYQTASISKLLGGLAMARASRMSHGPRLDDTVQQTADAHPDSLIAEWVQKKFGRNEESYPAEITVRRLLGHSAGLSNWGIGNSKSDNATELETILLGDPLTDSTKPRVRPGTDYCYSGGGVSAAEAMLEIHSGRKPRAFLNDMLEEYGLTKSTFNDASDSMTNLARGCSRGTCSTKPKHTEAKFAGGMLANPEEYARLVTFLMNDGKDENGRQVIPLADVQAVLTPTFHRSSSLRSCTAKPCLGGETCTTGRCMKPVADCDDNDSTWYGLGVRLDSNTPFGTGGFSKTFSHGGANPDGDSATHFEADRSTGRGVVIMVNGEYEWKKNGVVYGSNPLVDDIEAAFDRYF